jgi:O-antigen ligase
MFLIAALVAFIIYGTYSWASPKKGLAVLLAALPTYLIRFDVFGVPFTVLEGMILTLLLVCVMQSVWRGRLKVDMQKIFGKNKLFHVFVLLFLISAFVSTTYSVDLMRALGILRAYFIEPVIVLYLILSIFTSKKDLQNVLTLSSWPVFFISAAALFQYFGFGLQIPEGYAFPEKRATSIFPYPAALAWYLLPYLTMYVLFFLSVKHPKYKKAFYKNHNRYNRFYISHWLIVLVALATLVFSKAEGAIGAFALVIFGYLVYEKKYRLFALISGFAALLAAFLVPVLREYIWQVISFQNVSGEVRLALWEGTVNLLKARPITGAGLASFPEVYDQFRLARHVELLLYPHNIFLNFWVELGLLGLLSFIGLLVAWLGKAVNAIKKTQKTVEKSYIIALFGAMVAIVIYGLVDVPYFKNDLAVQFFMIIGLGFLLWRDVEPSR